MIAWEKICVFWLLIQVSTCCSSTFRTLYCNHIIYEHARLHRARAHTEELKFKKQKYLYHIPTKSSNISRQSFTPLFVLTHKYSMLCDSYTVSPNKKLLSFVWYNELILSISLKYVYVCFSKSIKKKFRILHLFLYRERL